MNHSPAAADHGYLDVLVGWLELLRLCERVKIWRVQRNAWIYWTPGMCLCVTTCRVDADASGQIRLMAINLNFKLELYTNQGYWLCGGDFWWFTGKH